MVLYLQIRQSKSTYDAMIKSQNTKIASKDISVTNRLDLLNYLQMNTERITPLFLLVKKFKLSDQSWIQGEMHRLLLLFLKMVNWKQVRGGISEILPFSQLLSVFTGIKPGTFGSKGQRVIHLAMSAEGDRQKKFHVTILLCKKDSGL